MLAHLSLFSGIGGLDPADKWAGFETVGQCEWADYPTKVLEKHWPEMFRVIRELAPRWVIGENIPGILRVARRTVCEDLEREGYSVSIFNYEAAAVGAPHRRERVFFVACNSNPNGLCERTERRFCKRQDTITCGICSDTANAGALGQRLQLQIHIPGN